MKRNKLMLICSTGGHLSELMSLESMYKKYDYVLITEKTKVNINLKKKYKDRIEFLIYGTKDHMLVYPFKLFINCFISLFYYIKYFPKVIITTGAHSAGPMCLIGKIFRSKVIYIETLANIDTKTITGKLLYPFSDLFIVQWKNMKNLYKKSVVCSLEDDK